MRKIQFVLLISLFIISGVSAQSEYFDFGQSGFEIGVFYGTSDGVKQYGLGGGLSIKGVADLNGSYGRVNYETFGYSYTGYETVTRGYDMYSIGVGLHPFNRPGNIVRLALTGSIGKIDIQGAPTVYTLLPYLHVNLNSGPNGYFKIRLGAGFSDVFDDVNEKAVGFAVIGGTMVVDKYKKNSMTFDINYTKTHDTYTIGFGIGLLISGRKD